MKDSPHMIECPNCHRLDILAEYCYWCCSNKGPIMKMYFAENGKHVLAKSPDEARKLLFGCYTDDTIYSYVDGWSMHYNMAIEKDYESYYTPRAVIIKMKEMIEEEQEKK